jgi:hypothetical protein
MEMTAEFFLSFIKYCLIGFAILMTALTIMGLVSVWRAGAEAIKPIAQLVDRGDLVRMLAVIFIVSAATGLVVIGKIDGNSCATILSGVAGYVLGSGARRQGQEPNAPKKRLNSQGPPIT